MKMAFFKIRAIAVFIMLASLATCGMLSNAPTGQIKKPDVQANNRSIVVIYSADWCGYCKKAKAFMRKNNIKFIEKSLNNSKDFKEITNLAKKLGINTNLLNVIPIFIVRNKIIIGFNPKEILCMLSDRSCDTEFFRIKRKF